jgi:hypothetical protein
VNWVLTGVPAATLASLALGLGAAITTLYLLRVRRRRVEVPWAPLWQRITESRLPTRWKERLRRLLSLLLQLALLALLLLALGDPRQADELEDGRSVVIVVDASASMGALDEAGRRTRIERAREAALAVVASLGPRDEAMVVRLDAQLAPLTPFVSEREVLEDAVRGLEVSATGAELHAALSLASDSLEGRPRGAIVLVSDGAFAEADLALAAADLRPGVAVQHVPIGTNDGNIGITAFNVRRYPANRTNFEVFVEVRSFVDVPVTAELSLSGGGRLIDTQTLDLAPRGVVTRIWPDLPAGGRELEASVRIVAGDTADVLAVDDRAFALLPDQRPPRVLVVTDGNLYLEAPFLLNESFDTRVVGATGFDPAVLDDPDDRFDLVVLDGLTPPIPERGNYLFLGPSGDDSPWPVRGDVVDPIIDTADRNHPLLRWIAGLRDVNIAQARRLTLTADDRVVASAIGGVPMLVVRDTIRGRVGALAFRPTESDLPLRVAFPVFVINAVDWFTDTSRALADSFVTGTAWQIAVGQRDLDAITLVAPSGREVHAAAWDGGAVVYGDEPGFWTLRAGDTERLLAANLSDPDESAIAPRTLDALAGVSVVREFDAASAPLVRDPWTLLVLAALGLLVLEWLSWNRRWTV